MNYRLAKGAQLALVNKVAHDIKVAYFNAIAKTTFVAKASQKIEIARTISAILKDVAYNGIATIENIIIDEIAIAKGITIDKIAIVEDTTTRSTTIEDNAITLNYVDFEVKVTNLMHNKHAIAIDNNIIKANAMIAFAHLVINLAMTKVLAYVAIRNKRNKI